MFILPLLTLMSFYFHILMYFKCDFVVLDLFQEIEICDAWHFLNIHSLFVNVSQVCWIWEGSNSRILAKIKYLLNNSQFTVYFICCSKTIVEPPHDKTNKMACMPSKDSDQLGHPPSLIRVFAVRMKKAEVLSYPLGAQRRLWSDWADA